MAQTGKTALIIGTSRGLGLGLAEAYLEQGWRVIATYRNAPSAPLAALQTKHGATLQLADLDVTDAASIARLHDTLAADTLDLLFVSAGINRDADKPIGDVSAEAFDAVMTTNALAPLRIIERFADRVPGSGVIVAMTSILGSVGANTTGGYELYRASKAALNSLLRSYAVRNPQRTIVAMHPGWVRTDMGGEEAALSVAQSVKGMTTVLNGQVGKPGCVYLDYKGKIQPW